MSDSPFEEADPEWALVMPFVCVKSKGGPYDDAAFAAGWKMGRLDVVLRAMNAMETDIHSYTIEDELIAQADMIAMRCGWTMEHEPVEDMPGWSDCRFRRVGPPV